MSTNLNTSPASRNWYAVHAYAGYETRVAEALRERVAAAGLDHRIGRILAPAEEVTEMRGGRPVTTARSRFPGMILIEMELDDELINLVKSTPKVTGFVGGTRPTPLSQAEVEDLLKPRPVPVKPRILFEIGDEVRILEGAFANFPGTVDAVDQSTGKLRVRVIVSGRPTSVEIDAGQVQKK